MIQKPLSARTSFLVAASSILLLLVLYTWQSERLQREAKRVNNDPNAKDMTLPTWSMLAGGVVKIWDPFQGREYSVAMKKRMEKQAERWIVRDTKATLWRFALGMLYGVCGAVVLGVLMGCFSSIEAFFTPTISMMSKIPPPVVGAVFFKFFGLGNPVFIAMIVFGVLPSLTSAVYLTIREFPEPLVVKARTLGASTMELIVNVIVPQVIPKLLDAVRSQIGPAIVYLIGMEFLVGDAGFGYRIRSSIRTFDMDVIYVYAILLMINGFMLDYLFRFAQAKLYPWYVKNGE